MWRLCAHAVFKGTGGDREAEVIEHVLDAIGAGGVQVAVSALGFDDKRSGLGTCQHTVTLRITDMDEEFDVAS